MAARRPRILVGVLGDSHALTALRRSLERERDLQVADGVPDGGGDAVLLELARWEDAGRRLAEVRDLTAAPVVLLAPSASGRLVDWALDSAVADVFVRPYDPSAVLFALEKAVRTVQNGDGAPATARVVTVFSPKGGSGKSVVSSNLATALARRGRRRVLLVDLDLQFGDAAIMLGLHPGKTFRELVASPAELDAEMLDVYTSRHRSGLEVLAAPLRPEDAELVSEASVRAVLAVARTARGAVLVDTPPFFHATTLASLDVTDELLLVCNPDMASVKNVRLALETLGQLSLRARVRVVLNRAGEAGGMRVEDVAEGIGRAPDVLLPFDPAVPAGVNRGVPAVLADQRSPFAEAMTGLARELFPEDWPAPQPRRPALARRRFAFARS